MNFRDSFARSFSAVRYRCRSCLSGALKNLPWCIVRQCEQKYSIANIRCRGGVDALFPPLAAFAPLAAVATFGKRVIVPQSRHFTIPRRAAKSCRGFSPQCTHGPGCFLDTSSYNNPQLQHSNTFF